MSHNTTSWKSHTSTWRWTAGNDGRSPQGGKPRRIGGYPALTRHKAVGQHDQGEMPMPPIPAPPLVVVQAALALGVFVALRDGPAAVRQLHQPGQRRVRWEIAVIPLDVAMVAGRRAFAQQPALWASVDALMRGRALALLLWPSAPAPPQTVCAGPRPRAARQVMVCQQASGKASRTALTVYRGAGRGCFGGPGPAEAAGGRVRRLHLVRAGGPKAAAARPPRRPPGEPRAPARRSDCRRSPHPPRPRRRGHPMSVPDRSGPGPVGLRLAGHFRGHMDFRPPGLIAAQASGRKSRAVTGQCTGARLVGSSAT